MIVIKPGTPLTPREQETLTLLAKGLPNKLIASQLHISEHTAKFHVHAVIRKLGVSTRVEAAVFHATNEAYLKGLEEGAKQCSMCATQRRAPLLESVA